MLLSALVLNFWKFSFSIIIITKPRDYTLSAVANQNKKISICLSYAFPTKTQKKGEVKKKRRTNEFMKYVKRWQKLINDVLFTVGFCYLPFLSMINIK